MAYSFGGGVRPELGRTDFTPFLQGSVRGAEMQAKGAENFAKGVASAGDSVADGVKTYFANKELVASRIGKIEGGMSDPEVMKRVMASKRGRKHMETMEKTGTLPLIASAELFSLVNEATEATATDMKRQMLESNLKLNAFKMSPPGPEAPPAAIRTLEIRAQEAGLQPGTPEYRQFMLYGGAPPADTTKPTEAEAKINRMVEAGVPRLNAIRINDGVEELKIDPRTGDMIIVDKATGTSKRVASPEQEDRPPIEPPKPGETLAEMAERATGLGASLLAVAQRVVGLGGQLAGTDLNVPGANEVIQFRQFFEASIQELIRSLSVNRRYPVSEQERIREAVDIMPRTFTDPRTLRAKMLGLDRFLKAQLEADERDANNRRLSVEDRSDAEGSAETIRHFRNILGADRIRQMPAATQPISGVPDDLVDYILPEDRALFE